MNRHHQTWEPALANFMATVWSAVIYTVYFTVAWSTTQSKYGSAVIYAICFTVVWSTTRNIYGNAVIYAVISPLHETDMEVLCNLWCYFTMGMVDYTKQTVIYTVYFTVAWSITWNRQYGSAVIYAVYFTVAWLTTRNKYGSSGEFSVFSVVVCAWSTTRNMCWRFASLGFAQAFPNNKLIYSNI